jgi:hypothetical protein
MKLLENRRTGNRQGVALILVVGMLALMMVMGVTFSIFMRTERLAAGHFRAGVQTRELLQVALARALDDIEFSVGTAVYPPWSILESGGLGDIHTNALSGSISNWIPLAVLEATNPAPRWIDIPSGGRVAYLVLNCSGLIDVNNAGGSVRASGTNVSEIQIATLPDIGTDANAAALVAGRPYETMQELGVKAAAALTGLPKNLVVYSNFPTNYSGGADLGLVDLSGGVSNLQDRKTGIISGLNKSGIPLSDQLFVYSNLLYYVDPSPVPMTPDDLGSPLTKSVPMINEVRVTNSVIMVGGGKSVTLVTVDIEWFYPFVKKSPFTFDIVCDVEITGVSSTLGKYVPPRIVSQSKPSTYSGQTGTYERVQFSTATNVTFTSNDTVQLAFKIGAKVLRGGDIVDSVPYPYDSASYLSATGMLMTIPTTLSGGVKGYECVDPRFNWSTLAASAQWIAYTPLNPNGTIKLPNWITGKLFPNKYLGLYVAGEPLHNVGELSYLLRGAKVSDKWSSIRIFTNSSVDRVLDHFMVQVSTNSRGLVNVNSRSADVLGTVFSGIQKEAYPGAGGAQVTPAEVASMATAVINQNLSPISRMSDYGTNTVLMSIINPVGTLTPFQAESVLRESAGLLHYRQNLFLVFLYAQPNKNANNTSGSQAMAEIWRDPVANSQSNHPGFVRSFKILNQ